MKGLKLTDILVTIVIALVFGFVYIIWGSFYAVVTPLGLHIDQLVYGMWFIAGIVAALIIRKPGVALLAEVAAASGEFLLGSPYGLGVLIAGVIQGLGAELVFMAYRYKRFDLMVAILASLGACVGSLLNNMVTSDLLSLSAWNLTLYVGARLIGTIFVCGLPAYGIVKVLDMTGVTNLVRPVAKEEYNKLEEE